MRFGVALVDDAVIPALDLTLRTESAASISSRYNGDDCPTGGWCVVRVYLHSMLHVRAYGGTFTCHHLPRERDLQLPSSVVRNRETNLHWVVEGQALIVRHVASGGNTQAEYTIGQLH